VTASPSFRPRHLRRLRLSPGRRRAARRVRRGHRHARPAGV